MSKGKIELEQVFEQKAAHERLAERSSEVMENRELVVGSAYSVARHHFMIRIVGDRGEKVDVGPAVGRLRCERRR